MGEIKQTNFRVDQERADAFRAYCEAQGINQAVGFERMLEALEMQNAKAAIPARETEISEFERALRHLQAAYLGSLELNQQAEARIREEFARQLDAKDRTIANNQDQIDALKAQLATLGDAEARAKALQADLEAALEQARIDRNNAADRLAEKDRLISTLDNRTAMLEVQASGYSALQADRDHLAATLAAAQADIKDLNREHEIAMERAAMNAERAQEAAVAAVRAEMAKDLADAQAALQQAQIDAERAVHEADMNAAAEIRSLEQQIAGLREQLAALKAKVPKEG